MFMEDKDIVNKICFLLKKKLELFKKYLSLTERIKETSASGDNIDASQLRLFLHKRQDCINSIDTIDETIKKAMNKKHFSGKYHNVSERFREILDPYLKGIKEIMEKIDCMDRGSLVMVKEETEHFKTELLKIRKFRQAMHGYKKDKRNFPRFLDIKK
jgi:hypothetical protein